MEIRLFPPNAEGEPEEENVAYSPCNYQYFCIGSSN